MSLFVCLLEKELDMGSVVKWVLNWILEESICDIIIHDVYWCAKLHTLRNKCNECRGK